MGFAYGGSGHAGWLVLVPILFIVFTRVARGGTRRRRPTPGGPAQAAAPPAPSPAAAPTPPPPPTRPPGPPASRGAFGTAGIARGWLPDPTARHQLRWWSGSGWTEQVSDDGVPGTDPYDHDGARPA